MSLCPRCGTGLRAEKMGAVVVDGCESCGGLWFDADELGQLAACGQESVTAAEGVFEPPTGAAADSSAEMQCPRCSVPLYGFEFRHTPGVTLDACPQCRGIWVDDRELEALAQRMTPQQRPAAEPATLRQNVRRAVTFIQRIPCRKCSEENHAGSLVCWACGVPLQGRRGAMLCPRCDNALYYTHGDSSGLALDTDPHVDHCHACGGVWIDIGALSLLLDVPIHWLHEWEQTLSAAASGAMAIRQADLVCPTCQVVLDMRNYAADSGIYVDRCATCRGTWLDRGELVAMKRVSIQADPWGGVS